jgi:flagellar biosynthesis/type III secretory pathway M-ring protein FliF/YscJ
VKVAYARHLAEAELIQGLLSQEHIPSMVRRSAGSDVPDFLAAGGRDILVSVADADRARELLA